MLAFSIAERGEKGEVAFLVQAAKRPLFGSPFSLLISSYDAIACRNDEVKP
jgi:hypothetical protein